MPLDLLELLLPELRPVQLVLRMGELPTATRLSPLFKPLLTHNASRGPLLLHKSALLLH